MLLVMAAGCEQTRRPSAIASGDRFPDFELPALDRRIWRREDIIGAPRLINFWATWCPPCRAEMAGLQALHERLRERGGGVVAIAVDDDVNLVREFLRTLAIDYPVLVDPGRVYASSRLVLQSYPMSFLVDRSGVVADVVVGAREWDAPGELAAVLAAIG